MPSLKLYTSNRVEILAQALAQVLSTPLASPLAKEVIVVQSQGMERWVSMELAKHHGICANYSFPFPNHFVYDIFRRVISGIPEFSLFDPKVMTWRVMKLLPACMTRPGFQSLRDYVGHGAGNLGCFQLSERIADTFDQYLLFRPEMILEWEAGKGRHWQAALWRELVKGHEGEHRAALGKALCDELQKPSAKIKDLPERVSVFGISALPPFHIQVLAALSRLIDVNLFLMNPCQESWGHLLADREMRRTTGRWRSRDLGADGLRMEKRNTLLASMGTLGRDFFDLVKGFDCKEVRSFEDPGQGTLLSCIQSDILNLRERSEGSEGRKPIESNDRSVQFHSCHSPMREMEVLRDNLIDLFQNDPSLMPKDILVMTPDIEKYAPYVQAIFDTPRDDPQWIPFSIADRSMRKESEVADTFLAILDLCGGRFGASQVLAILECQAVLRKFGLAESALDLIRKWVNETRIRWGVDQKSRGELGLPEFPENTWRAGLDRLLLGYAMPGQEENMFGGVLPYDLIEGDETAVLGEFIHFAGMLFAITSSLRHPRTLDEWASALRDLLDHFFVPDEETEREMQAIRSTLSELGAMQDEFDQELEINVIRWHLGARLKREGFGFGFITGRATFCEMLPMRSIPFRIVCLVGMNGDAYPRQSRQLGFDLIAKEPRPGDRSLRNEDRYLFIEAILSARERLYISYVGQSIQDNSLRPPSVLVSELLDYVEEGFEIPGKGILDHIAIKHHLQAFSPEYFKGNERHFSYSDENYQAARRIQENREAVPFISGGLTEPGEEWKAIDVADLCSFFANPTKFLVNRRLRIYLEEEASILGEKESFDIKGLEKYLFEQNLVERRLAGRDLKDFLAPTRASGLLPHGTVGACLYERLSRGVETFVEKTQDYLRGGALEPLEVDLSISGVRVTGRIDGIYAGRLIRYRYAQVKPKDRLRIWIYHLLLNMTKAEDYPRASILAGLEKPGGKNLEWAAWEYDPVENSEQFLGKLLDKYWEGLVRPLHFFPESSWEYAYRLLRKGKSEMEALRRARDQWEGSDYSRGEREDLYYQRCFSNVDPLDATFQRISLDVFEPLLAHEADRKDDRV